jgi:hypothetical protein
MIGLVGCRHGHVNLVQLTVTRAERSWPDQMTAQEDMSMSKKTAPKPGLAPVAAIAAAVKNARKKAPIASTSVGVGIGSAALVAALMYAGKRKPRQPR